MSEAKRVIEIVRADIETVDKALTLYDRATDRVMPWSEYDDTLVAMDHRKEYSVESAKLIGEIKTLLMDGVDAYASTTQNVHEWAGLMIPLLRTYHKLLDDYTPTSAEAQKKILLKILDDGLAKTWETVRKLDHSSAYFGRAAAKLGTLNEQLESEFDKNGEIAEGRIRAIRLRAYVAGAWYGIPGLSVAAGVVEGKLIPQLMEEYASIKKFYVNLKERVVTTFRVIGKTTGNMKDQVEQIRDLKTKIEGTEMLLSANEVEELRETVLKAIQDLTAEFKK